MTETSADDRIEIAIKACDFHAAASLAFERYGSEILSFLVARMRAYDEGHEAFSMFAEDFWKGLPSFRARCSVRGWMYTLARNAANRYAASPQRKREHAQTLASDGAALSGLVEQAKSSTALHLKTRIKSRMRQLREQLDVDDQTLLILHVDRGLPWRELAVVMHSDGLLLDDEAVSREAARLRKRFERVKAELKELAMRDGLFKRP